VGELTFLSFTRVPTDVNVVIHGRHLVAILEDPVKLEAMVREHFKDFHQIDVSAAKFLEAQPEIWTDKKATSIIV